MDDDELTLAVLLAEIVGLRAVLRTGGRPSTPRGRPQCAPTRLEHWGNRALERREALLARLLEDDEHVGEWT